MPGELEELVLEPHRNRPDLTLLLTATTPTHSLCTSRTLADSRWVTTRAAGSQTDIRALQAGNAIECRGMLVPQAVFRWRSSHIRRCRRAASRLPKQVFGGAAINSVSPTPRFPPALGFEPPRWDSPACEKFERLYRLTHGAAVGPQLCARGRSITLQFVERLRKATRVTCRRKHIHCATSSLRVSVGH